MRVLLAFDGSPDAAQAAALVGAIAWPPDSTLRVVSVIEPTPMLVTTPWVPGELAAPGFEARVAAYFGAEQDSVVQRLVAPHRAVDGAVMRGRPASVIVDEARVFGADLAVVGSRGHGTVATLALGSVSSEVVDHAPCPVLVAKRPGLSRVLFASDGSPAALAAEAVLTRWPIFDGVPIRVVSVAEVVEPWHTGIAPTMYTQVVEAYAHDLKEARAEHTRIGDESVARLRAAGRDAEPELRTGDAAAEIIGAAADRDADLVVLGSRGRTGLTRLLLGSVARNVLHGGTASVLIVRGARS